MLLPLRPTSQISAIEGPSACGGPLATAMEGPWEFGQRMAAMAKDGAFAWGERMAVALAGGDDNKLNMLREIYTRYKDEEEMREEARMVVRTASEEERIQIKGKTPLEIIRWAMMMGRHDDLGGGWLKHFASGHSDWLDRIMDGHGEVIMTLRPTPGGQAMTVETDDDVRVVPRQKVARVLSQLPRRSPRFPRRSARIQALARSADDE
uniref:Uncharacterized protein n=1 Tax=Hordeum vulgare subsp. vulgare TaxID=112509 RepID=A0A8I6Y731_HORVV